MISADPLNIHFSIPAQDPLGRMEVHGKLRFLAERVELFWRVKGNVFRGGGEKDMKLVPLPYGEIENVELVKRWWRIRQIILRVADPTLVAEIPGVDMGKMILEIDERSRHDAKKLAPLIDFRRSIFLLDEQTKRLQSMRD